MLLVVVSCGCVFLSGVYRCMICMSCVLLVVACVVFCALFVVDRWFLIVVVKFVIFVYFLFVCVVRCVRFVIVV